MLFEPVDLEYWSYSQRLSLGGSSDEAAARIANHVLQHSVLAASASAGMGAVLPPALRQMFALRHRNSRAAALSVNHEDLLTAAASLTADKECPTMQYLTSWINCS